LGFSQGRSLLNRIIDFPQEADMQRLERKNKTYLLDDDGFLIDPGQWDEDFAEGMAPEMGIPDGLTTSHWEVLRFIRATYLKTNSCPTVHKTCRAQRLSFRDLQMLFPSGYQRGACKLAGVSFMAEGVSTPFYPIQESPIVQIPLSKRVYRVNVQGFLIDPNEWDEDFAIFKARELQMPEPLGEKHWQVIRYLRSACEKTDEVPTVYTTCEAMGIDIDELSELFPSGYHRGAVKIAGLNLAAKRRRETPAVAAR
jgi:tRNA 2-thiouridine synthesizing protein E